MKDSTNTIYDAAQYWKEQGLDPLPIPHLNGHPTKKPCETDWPSIAAEGYSNDDFRRPCNLGILLGGTKKKVADVDADSLFAALIAADVLPELFPQTFKFGHQSKPCSHHIYSCDENVPSEEVTDPITGKMVIELRCLNKDGNRGQQTVFPPSIHYDPETGIEERIELAPTSADKIVEVSGVKLVKAVRIIGATALISAYFPASSKRHVSILALSGMLARGGMEIDAAIRIVSTAYRYSAGYNKDRRKIENDIRGVYKTLAGCPETHVQGYPTLIGIIPKEVIDKVLELLGIERPKTSYPLTDSGNARWLTDNYGEQIRFCPDAKSWFNFDGIRWAVGEMAIRELAKKRGQALRHQAECLKAPEPTGEVKADREAQKHFEVRQKAMLHWANRSENSEGIRGTLFAAASDPAIICSRSDFDQNHHLLNVANGVIDMYTGTLMKHDQSFMLTKLCPTEYDPNATHKVWNTTLKAITRKHSDLESFLQVLAGYSAQGDKTEERIISLQGPKRTGKGTFNDCISSTLGEDYVVSVAPETVLKQNRNSAAPSSDIARLEGTRIVLVSELEKGNRLQESFLKLVSGNDSVVARGMFKEDRQFRPTWQFWFQTNNRLGFDSTDSGNVRRYLEVPFDNDLSTDGIITFDPNLKSWMRGDKEFHKAVLAWIVAGSVRWRKERLQVPKSVVQATKDLFATNDFLRDFIDERCVVGSDEKVFLTEMTHEYELYCQQEGEEPARGRTFNHMLEERGYKRRQATINGRNGKAWRGIRLKTPRELHDATIAELTKDKNDGSASLDSCLEDEEEAA